MKKLLLLGGSRYLLPVIEAAHNLGLYVITCDYLPDNIAHRYSDEYANVSIIEKEKVLEKARELQIDGIMSFACDPGVTTAAYVAEKMGLPSVGSYESVSILQNKGRFRKFLSDNGFNAPVAKGYTKAEDAVSDAGIFNWPVIVKPVDSAGSKGVKKVDKVSDLEAAIKNALSYSHCDEFIVEDYLEKEGCSSDSDCFSVDGEMKFFSFSSQRFDLNAENPYTPAAFSWPSTLSGEHISELESELQRLISLLGLGTSVYNVETRECINGKAYIMELSPRGGGNRLSEMIRYGTGVDLITNAVRAAVGLELNGIEQKAFQGNWSQIILHSTKPGIFDNIWVNDEIRKNVVETDLWVKPGDEIGGFKGANEAIGTLVLKFDSQDDLLNVLSNQDKYVKVILK